ncbi:hypothetical protein G3I60_36410 [Streptomyces sp. SID13666]|uniref:hypothetical protein n=1 Tax=Streptomyces sp. SID13666 TaxID=2706054 RepID=UPI0013C0435E|nr:hypothetical protein [Streptomyces sp. SID13666]NEA59501.1 hypothetical protein [Streptomyces sp. SID13666]
MRPVTFNSLVRYTGSNRTGHWRPERMTVDTALQCIRRGRRGAATVHVYETTDRDGNSVHLAYVHFGTGRWSNAEFVTDIYEIPSVALTDI